MFQSDRGSQFTSGGFTGMLRDAGVRMFRSCNQNQPHQAFGGLTPAEMYGLASPSWPIDLTHVKGDAATPAAVASALRNAPLAAQTPEPTHLN